MFRHRTLAFRRHLKHKLGSPIWFKCGFSSAKIILAMAFCGIALLRQAMAVDVAVVQNQCPYPVYIWSVDQLVNPAYPTEIPSSSMYREELRTSCDGCGVSIKVSRTQAIEDITQFEYAFFSNGTLYYDISLIDCVQGTNATMCPGWELGLRMVGGTDDGECGEWYCPPGEYCPADAYYVPWPGLKHPVKMCSGKEKEGEISFVLCSG